MKILYVITSLLMGGAEKLVADMIPRLVADGDTVDLAVFNGEETPLMQKLRTKAPTIRIYKLGHGYYNPLYIFKLVKIMRHYDIVHTHNSSPQLFVAIASVLCSVKLCSTEHTTSNRKRSWKWYAPIESWMYGRYDHVICISKIAEQKLREYMGGRWLDRKSKDYNRISTINNGVDVKAIHDAQPDNELLQMKGSRAAVLMVAGFRVAKDQDTVVNALNILDRERYEVWLAGVGVRMDTVKTLVEELKLEDRVRFLGLRTDIPNVLKSADIIVMSSHWEGLSLSNIEGMSAGKPFIASDVDGLREVTSGAGILFQESNSAQLADTISRLTDDKEYYDTVAAACYQRAMQFDIHKMVQGYEAVYESLVAGSRS